MLTALVAVLTVCLTAGCSRTPDVATSTTIADEMRDEAQETMQTVVDGLQAGGVEIPKISGSYSACGMSSPQLEYSAGGYTTPESGSIAEQMEVARQVIEELELPMKEMLGEDQISTDISKTDLRVSASPSRTKPGSLVVEVKRDCVDVDDTVVDERLNEGVETIE